MVLERSIVKAMVLERSIVKAMALERSTVRTRTQYCEYADALHSAL